MLSARGNCALLILLLYYRNILAKECLPCDPNDAPLPAPGIYATSNNGVRWPTMCVPETPEGQEEHAFTIGDWGGIGQHAKTFDNTAGKRGFVWGLDDKAQHLVADLMKKVAVTTKPKYILNVGDNFYPGGLEAHCANVDMCSYIQTGQWENLWVNVYDGPDLGHLEWWGCLGNHDFGGFSYGRAWEQQFAFTWHHDRWLIPAMYWERKVQYCDFSVDYYFLDTNRYDAQPPGDDPGHNICSGAHNGGKTCEKVGGPTSAGHCYAWFKKIFWEQLNWLDERLNQSTADWQIIVTHFPPQYGAAVWREVAKKHGVDIFIAGHRHQQEVHYHDRGGGWMSLDLGGTAWTVTGGGGGVTSEGMPFWESAYTQQYGFMDLTLSKDQIHIDMWSAVTRKVRRRITVTPVAPFDYSRRRRSRRRRALLNESAEEGSCARYGCMDTWEHTYPCQCSQICLRARKCCYDYRDVCSPPQRRLDEGDEATGVEGGTQVSVPPMRDGGRDISFYSEAEKADERRLRGNKPSHAPFFEELNLSQDERCSAQRRRTSYVATAPEPMTPGDISELTGNFKNTRGPMHDIPMADQLPQDFAQTRSDLSTEPCLDHCNGKSGYCPYFCGVGKACCAEGSITDDPVCQTAEAFTEAGRHECVSIKDVDGNLFMKEMGAWPSEVPASDGLLDITAPAAASVKSKEETGSVPWWAWFLGIGATAMVAGFCIFTSPLERASSKRQLSRRSPTSTSDAAE